MSTATSFGIPDLQTAISGVEQVGAAAAAPFIHSDSGKATEQKVLAEVNLGIAALPLLGNLFTIIGGLFHHAHKVATQPPSPPATPPPSA
jgi:hypothetical protein